MPGTNICQRSYRSIFTSIRLLVAIIICVSSFVSMPASPVQAATFTISGNAGVGGVTLSYFDVTEQSVPADGSGDYSLPVTEGWTGDVTPSLPGYTFSPPSRSYTNVIADATNENYTATPIEYALDITSDHGTVAKVPDQVTYHYGDVVQLTATPDTGWTFASWSGGETGADNPVEVTILGDTTVTANYTQDEYTLSITSDHGTVAKNPDQVTYHYGDVVQLTATADPDWIFTGWSGDKTGADNPVLVTILGNTSVTANYVGSTVTISGNAGVAGADLTYTVGIPQTVKADSWGDYTLVVPYNWSGTVKPTSLGYTFTPATQNYTNVTTDLINQNYTVGVSDKTYYVDKTNLDCSNLGGGISPDFPFCTITKAASVAIAGDTIVVLAGTYAETVKPNPGIADHPVTVTALPGVTVTGEPGNTVNGGAFRMSIKSYIIIDGFDISDTADYGIYGFKTHHITISNNEVSYAGTPGGSDVRQGIWFDETTDSLITGNIVHHNSLDGILLLDSSNNIVSENHSFANATSILIRAVGISLYGSYSNTILHNFTYANEDSGIHIYSGSNNNKVIGNVSYGNGDHGIDCNNVDNTYIVGNTVQGNVTTGINLEAISDGSVVMNNVMMDNGLLRQAGGGTSPEGLPGNLRADSTSSAGTTFDYNLFYLSEEYGGTVQIIFGTTSYSSLANFKASVPGQEVHGLEANPLFENPAPPAERPAAPPYDVELNLGDYHLNAGSPAIDSANSNAAYEPLLDIEGNSRFDDPLVANTGAGVRTYDDRGAYEWQGVITTTLTVEPVSGVYGSTVTLTATLSPAVNNKTINFTLNSVTACSGITNASGVATCTTQLLADVNVYPAGVGASFAGDMDYGPSSDTAALTVTPKTLTGYLTAANKIYDGSTAAVVLTRGLTGVISPDDVSLTGGTASFADANAGVGKVVTLTGATLAGADKDNYVLGSVDTALADITPKPITVTPDSGKFKYVGGPDPVFTYTYLPNDPPITFTGALSRAPGEDPGTYAITIGTLSAGINYSITLTPEVFTILEPFRLYLPMIMR